jgi:hypothetical protein
MFEMFIDVKKKLFDIFEIKQIYFSFQNLNLHNQILFFEMGNFFSQNFIRVKVICHARFPNLQYAGLLNLTMLPRDIKLTNELKNIGKDMYI